MHYQILKVDFPLANISISTLKGIIKNEFWKSKPFLTKHLMRKDLVDR